MRGTIHQALERARLLLLVVGLLLCCAPTAQAIHCPTPVLDFPAIADSQKRLNAEMPSAEPSARYMVRVVNSQGRIGLFVGNNPINNVDPLGLEAGYTYDAGGMHSGLDSPAAAARMESIANNVVIPAVNAALWVNGKIDDGIDAMRQSGNPFTRGIGGGLYAGSMLFGGPERKALSGAKKCEWIKSSDFAKDLGGKALDYFRRNAANLETGQHGEVYKKAGNYLIQYANQNERRLLPEILKDLKTEGNRLINYGNSVSHK